jgi:hypothetical protein
MEEPDPVARFWDRQAEKEQAAKTQAAVPTAKQAMLPSKEPTPPRNLMPAAAEQTVLPKPVAQVVSAAEPSLMPTTPQRVTRSGPTRPGPDILLLDETGVKDLSGRRVDSVENFSANRPRYSQFAPGQRLQDGMYGADPARPISVGTQAGVQVVRGPLISRTEDRLGELTTAALMKDQIGATQRGNDAAKYKSFQVVEDPSTGEKLIVRGSDDGSAKVTSLIEEQYPSESAILKPLAQETQQLAQSMPKKYVQRVAQLRAWALEQGLSPGAVDYYLPLVEEK